MLSKERPANLGVDEAQRIITVLSNYLDKFPERDDRALVMVAEWDLAVAARIAVCRLKSGHKRWCKQNFEGDLVQKYFDDLSQSAPEFSANSEHRHYALAGKRLHAAIQQKDPAGIGEVLSYISKFFEFSQGYVDRDAYQLETRKLFLDAVRSVLLG